MGGFYPLVELHREESAPAACAAGLFLKASLIVSTILALPCFYYVQKSFDISTKTAESLLIVVVPHLHNLSSWTQVLAYQVCFQYIVWRTKKQVSFQFCQRHCAVNFV